MLASDQPHGTVFLSVLSIGCPLGGPRSSAVSCKTASLLPSGSRINMCVRECYEGDNERESELRVVG